MILIRKFVGYTGAAAGIITATALAASAQAAFAAAPWGQSTDRSIATQAAVSPECTAAFQNIKAAAAADASEDAAERTVAKTNPDLAADRSEDSTERANFVSLFSAARTACAPAIAAPVSTKFMPSTQCAAAVQALKAAWAVGRPTTSAQWTQLQSLAQAVRAACGWTDAAWTDRR